MKSLNSSGDENEEIEMEIKLKKQGKKTKLEKISQMINGKMNMKAIAEKNINSSSTSMMNMIKQEEEEIAKKIKIINYMHRKIEKLRVNNRRKKTYLLVKILMNTAKEKILNGNELLIAYYMQEKQIGEFFSPFFHHFFTFYIFFHILLKLDKCHHFIKSQL